MKTATIVLKPMYRDTYLYFKYIFVNYGLVTIVRTKQKNDISPLLF